MRQAGQKYADQLKFDGYERLGEVEDVVAPYELRKRWCSMSTGGKEALMEIDALLSVVRTMQLRLNGNERGAVCVKQLGFVGPSRWWLCIDM